MLRHAIVALLAFLPLAAHARDYQFDGQISRPVLENYLSRSITMLDLLTRQGNVDDNIRMLRSIGAKFAGRSIYLWGQEGQLRDKLAAARKIAPEIHAARHAALAADMTKIPFDTYSGYFVSNRFEPGTKESFVVISSQEDFDQVFGVAFVMQDRSHRLPSLVTEVLQNATSSPIGNRPSACRCCSTYNPLCC